MLPVMAQSNQQDGWESSSLTSREPSSHMWCVNSRPIKFITYHRDSKETGTQRSSLSPGFYYLSHRRIRRFQAWDSHGLFDSYSSLPWSGPYFRSLTQSLNLLWLSLLLALVPLSLPLSFGVHHAHLTVKPKQWPCKGKAARKRFYNVVNST